MTFPGRLLIYSLYIPPFWGASPSFLGTTALLLRWRRAGALRRRGAALWEVHLGRLDDVGPPGALESSPMAARVCRCVAALFVFFSHLAGVELVDLIRAVLEVYTVVLFALFHAFWLKPRIVACWARDGEIDHLSEDARWC